MSIEKLKVVANELAESQRKLQEFAQNEGKQAIGAAFQHCFDIAPQVTKVVWTQYTPYFNDGDTCEFGVNDPAVYISSDDQDSSHYDHEISQYIDGNKTYYGSEYIEQRNRELDERYGREFVEAFFELWSALPDELLQQVFGDHAKITVTRDSVEVDGYDHD